MASQMMVKIACVFVLAYMLGSASAAITCGFAQGKVVPCINYLQNGGAPPKPCCDGVKALNAAATTIPDRQAACACLKQAASSIPGLQAGLVSSLPATCRVSLPFKLSPTMDCSRMA